ncbi:MAG TPA: hypothetical protein VGA99_03980 [bacterium]
MELALAIHLFGRVVGHEEEGRYQLLRKNWDGNLPLAFQPLKNKPSAPRATPIANINAPPVDLCRGFRSLMKKEPARVQAVPYEGKLRQIHTQ